MSYARWSAKSDVYVFASREGVTCCGCLLLGDEMSFHAASTMEMVGHLDVHAAAGHTVPSGIAAALNADDERNFPPAAPTGVAGDFDFDALWEYALDVNSIVTRDAHASYDRSLRRK